MSCLGAAEKKSCRHKITEALAGQVDRVEKGDYPESVILGVAKSILKYIKKRVKDNKRPSEKNLGLLSFAIFMAFFIT